MKEKVSKIMKTVIALMLAVILAVPAIPKTAEAASKPSAPAITKVVNASSGVTVTWKKVSSASGYYVYRKTGSGSYTKIATVKKNSTVTYTDKKASAGKTYTYAVKAYNSKGTSGYGAAKTIKRLTQPSVKVANASSGIKISWGKVSGASKYRVYYKKSGKWVKLADTSSTSYTDKSVKSGSSRTYTVKALSGSYGSSYMSGKTMKRLSQPSVKVANTSSGIKVSWGKVTGASKYRIYYKKDGKWATLADTSSTSYIDKSVKSGSSRTYTVKAISGSYGSSYVSGVTMMRLDQPVVKVRPADVKAGREGVEISWEEIAGVEKYLIYYKNSEGKWAKLTERIYDPDYDYKDDRDATRVFDTSLESGKTRTYTVKAVNGKYASSYVSGVTTRYLDCPVVTSICEKDGIRFNWNPVTGADHYDVYYNHGNEGLEKLGTVKAGSKLTWLYKESENGADHYFAFIAVSSDGYESSPRYKAESFFASPVVSAKSVDGGILVSWDEAYALYPHSVSRKNAEGEWVEICHRADELSYLDTDVEMGKSYTYTVRVINPSKEEYETVYDETGVTVTYEGAVK